MEKELEHLRVELPKVKIPVRCPNCLKLYSVDAYAIAEAHPQFQCTSCQEKFWISYPECLGHGEIIGFPEKWRTPTSPPLKSQNEVLEPPKPDLSQEAKETHPPENKKSKSLAQCPACKSDIEGGQEECSSCGVLIAKAREKVQDPMWFYATAEAKSAWVKVLDDFENHELHHEFIRKCRVNGELEFATSRYSRLLEAHPNNEIANKYKLELIALASMAFEKEQPILDTKPRRKWPITSIILFMCGILITSGYLLPEFRNLVGIGTSALFLTLAIRYYFK